MAAKRLDIQGQKFGKLTPLQVVGQDKYKNLLWLCKCDCGNEKVLASYRIIHNKVVSCGCARHYIDYSFIGKRFNELVVIAFARKGVGSHFYECLCDCGKTVVFSKTHIENTATACGCHKRGKRHCKWTGYEEISGSQWSQIKRNAEIRSLEFSITIEYIWEVFIEQEKKCALTNLPIFFSNDTKKQYLTTASLDRIDSSKGYIEGNIQWIHKDLQDMKWDKKQEEFIKLCNLVAKTHPLTIV